MNRVELDIFLNEIKQKQPDFEYDIERIDVELFAKEADEQTGTVRILSGIGGFISAILFVGLLFATELFDIEYTALIFGLLFAGVSVWANSKFDAVILDTASVALYLSGGFLIAYGLDDMNWGYRLIALALTLMSAVTLYFANAFFLRFLSFLVIIGSLYAFVFETELATPFVMLLLTGGFFYMTFYEAKLLSMNKRINEFFNPLKMSLLVGVIFYVVYKAVSTDEMPENVHNYVHWGISLLLSVGIIYMISQILLQFDLKQKSHELLIYGASILALLPVITFPEITGTVLLILMSYYSGYLLGLFSSSALFIFVMIMFYVRLDYTLLVKSYILLSSGALTAGAYFLIRKVISK